MNESKLIRQYILLSVVLLIAIFIATQIEWSNTAVRNIIPYGDSASPGVIERARSTETEMNFRDLRTGGLTRSSRQQKPGMAFSPSVKRETTAATSSAFAATSTPFQTGTDKQAAYSGVNITFSKLIKQ